MRFIVTVLILLTLITSQLWAKKISHVINMPYHSYLSYSALEDKSDAINEICNFSNKVQQEQVVSHICALDQEALKNLINSKKIVTQKAEKFVQSCNLNEPKKVFSVLKQSCAFQTSLSRKKIIGDFCKMPNDIARQALIENLETLVQTGQASQKPPNFNNTKDFERKHRELTLSINEYDLTIHPHIEAAYQLGVIRGFSNCESEFKNFDLAISAFEKAGDKPETSFMLAELLRQRGNIKNASKIIKFYEYATKYKIKGAAYNLALYMYDQLQQQQKKKITLPSEISAKNVIKFLQIAIKNKHHGAYNDMPILLKFLYNNISDKKIDSVSRIYFKKAAKKGFDTSIYNEIIYEIKSPFTSEKGQLIAKNLQHLLERAYQGSEELRAILSKHDAYAPYIKTLKEQFEASTHLYHQKSTDIDPKLIKFAHKLSQETFKPFDQYEENTLH